MKKRVIVIACVCLAAFAGCERVEKGIEGKREAKELKEQVNKSIKELQKSGRESAPDDEKKTADVENTK